MLAFPTYALYLPTTHIGQEEATTPLLSVPLRANTVALDFSPGCIWCLLISTPGMEESDETCLPRRGWFHSMVRPGLSPIRLTSGAPLVLFDVPQGVGMLASVKTLNHLNSATSASRPATFSLHCSNSRCVFFNMN